MADRTDTYIKRIVEKRTPVEIKYCLSFPSLFLSVCLSVSLALSVCLSVCLSRSVCLSVCLSLSLYIYILVVLQQRQIYEPAFVLISSPLRNKVQSINQSINQSLPPSLPSLSSLSLSLSLKNRRIKMPLL